MSASTEEYCRLCLRDEGNISVFDDDSDKSYSLSDRIFDCLSVQISLDDILPASICKTCFQNVQNWCEFKNVCDRTQRTWCLWMKSLSHGSKEEIQEGLRENAKRKNVELGYISGCNARNKHLTPKKSITNTPNYESSEIKRRNDETDIILIEEEQNKISNSVLHMKEIRIESTQSLVTDFYYGNKSVEGDVCDFQEVNGSVSLDSDNSCSVPERPTSVSSLGPDQVISLGVSRDVEQGSLNECDKVSDTNDTVNKTDLVDSTVCNGRNTVQNANVQNATGSESVVNNECPEISELRTDGETLTEVASSENNNRTEGVLQDLSEQMTQQESCVRSEKATSSQEPQDGRAENEASDCQEVSPQTAVEPLISVVDQHTDSTESRHAAELVPQEQTEVEPNLEEPLPHTAINTWTQPGPSTPATSFKPHFDTPYPHRNYMEQSLDCRDVRIKEEPLSDNEMDTDQNDSYLNFSVKSEPSDYSENYDMDPPHSFNDSLIKKKNLFCEICQQKFKGRDSLIKHFESEIHRKISNCRAKGLKITRKLKKSWSSQIAAAARHKGLATQRARVMKIMRPKEISDLMAGPNNDVHSTLDKSELLECKVCNIILKSRALKVKHDRSALHLNAVERLNTPETIIQPIIPNQQNSLYKLTTYACPFADCSVSFVDGGQLIVHMHSHGISMPMQEVDKQIKLNQQSKTGLPATVSNNNGNTEPLIINRSVCNTCGLAFKNGTSLSNHLRKGGGCKGLYDPAKQTQFCNICNIHLKNHRSLIYHMKMYHSSVELPPLLPTQNVPVTSQMVFKCPSCTKTFRSKMLLNIHSKIHKKGINVYHTCRFCKKSFSRSSTLKNHLKNHFPVKKGEYICLKCLEIFDSRGLFNRHKLAGCTLKMTIFSCNDCDHSYRTQELLDQHKETSHLPTTESSENVPEVPEPVPVLNEDINNTYCELCDKNYASNANYRRHFKLHFEEKKKREYPCPECLEVFPNIIKRHSHVCSKSPKVQPKVLSQVSNLPPVSSSPLLYNEIATSTDSSFSSEKERTHKCYHCDSKYLERRYLMNHLKNNCRFVPIMNCNICGQVKKRTENPDEPCRPCRRAVARGITLVDTPVQPVTPGQSATPAQAQMIKKQVSTTLHRCPLGKRFFLSQKSMSTHVLACSGNCKDIAVFCKSCHKSYASPRLYLKHKPVCGQAEHVVPDADVPCHFCPKHFRSAKSRSEHMRLKHSYSVREAKRKAKLLLLSEEENAKQDESNVNEEPVTNEDSSITEGQEVAANVNVTPPINENISLSRPELDKSFTCKGCLLPFGSKSALSHHIKYFHKNNIIVVQCAFCSTKIYRRELYEHGIMCVRGQLENIPMLECVSCNIEFYNTDEPDTVSLKLQEHIIHCGGKLPVKKGDKFRNKEKVLCLKCCMLFSSKTSHQVHMAKRHGIVTVSPKADSSIAEEGETSDQLISEVEPPQEPSLDNTETTDETPVDDSIEPQSEMEEQTPKEKPTYKCAKCYKTFRMYKTLKAHNISAHTFNIRKRKMKNNLPKMKPNLKCQFCDRHFFSESKLLNHEKVHGIVKENVFSEDIEEGPSQLEEKSGADVSLETEQMAETAEPMTELLPVEDVNELNTEEPVAEVEPVTEPNEGLVTDTTEVKLTTQQGSVEPDSEQTGQLVTEPTVKPDTSLGTDEPST